MLKLPQWFRQPLPDTEELARMRSVIKERALHTVCEGARCPNMAQCWSRRTATFMILGDTCTRSCRFCAVRTGRPLPVDQGEPGRIAQAINDLGVKYAVITSVTRDDLPDAGAGHFARTIRAIKDLCPSVKVEALVPDFYSHDAAYAPYAGFETVAAAGVDVIGHNIETVRRLSPLLRPQAGYDRSLRALRLAHSVSRGALIKSGLMVGLGETDVEVLAALSELKEAGCDVVTIGQYLAPAADGRQRPVARFVDPKIFDMYRRQGMAMGFAEVFSGPLVRSSFMADTVYASALEGASL